MNKGRGTFIGRRSFLKAAGTGLAAAGLVPIFSGCGSRAEKSGAGKIVTVGGILTFTGAGGTTGSAVCPGLLDHLMWVNEKGGIEYHDPLTATTERVKMRIVWEDSAYDAAKAGAIYKRLKAEGAQIFAIFGSTPGEAIAASLARDKLPGISLYAYGSPAGYRPEPQYYAAGWGSIIDQYGAIATWFKQNWKQVRPPNFAAMVMDIPSWRVFATPDGVPATVEKLGGKWLGQEWVPPIVADTSVQLSRLMSAGADFIGVYGTLGVSTVIGKDAARLGIDKDKVTIHFDEAAWDESIPAALGPAAEGLYGEVWAADTDADVPGTKLVKDVMAWRGRGPEENSYNYRTGFGQSYLIIAGIKQALEKVGYAKLTPTDIRDALFSLKDVPSDGLMQPFSVTDSSYPFFAYRSTVTRVQGGKITRVANIETRHIKAGER